MATQPRRRPSVTLSSATVASKALQAFSAHGNSRKLGHMSVANLLRRPSPPDLIQTMINSSPGCYQGDDGSTDICERYNFYAHGKRFLFAPCSLGVFDESNRFRQAIIWCITWKRFDQFILLLIFANSIILSLADYSKVDKNGDLDSSTSIRNAIVNRADRIFTIFFSIECSMKIIAMGLIGERGAYLMDPWNWLDFVVVFFGILAVIPGIPNVSVLRTFRVLRPLRSLNAVAGMKKLVSALLKSIPELLTVVAFLIFLFFLYGVIGVQLWSGVLHPRCRLTPYPVRLDPNVTYTGLQTYQEKILADYSLFTCNGDDGQPIPVREDATHDTSPWRTPRMCYWPIADEQIAQTCALSGTSYRQCPTGQTCGSDFDFYGNFRFTHPDKDIMLYVLHGATYNADMSWGYANFDHIGAAALSIFQCITREGWSDIMYMLQDAGYGLSSVFFFVSFIIFGSFFMLNLTLAVIWENFSEASLEEAEEKKLRLASQALKSKHKISQPHFLTKSPFRTIIGRIIQHWLFSWFRTALILLNTIILSLDQYPEDSNLEEVVEIINFGLMLAFCAEIILKVIGLGWKAWSEDRYNWRSSAKLKNRVVFWSSIRQTLRTIQTRAVLAIAPEAAFHDVQHNPRNMEAVYVPRANFDTILWSMVTVFQILTGENWNVVMYDGWRSAGWSAVLYFISLIVFGNFIVLNLFLAILLGNFEESSEDEKREEREREELRKRARVAPATGNWRSEREDRTQYSGSHDEDHRPKASFNMTTSGRSRRGSNAVFDERVASTFHRQSVNAPKKVANRSLLILTVHNPVRKFCIKVISHPHFDSISLALIAISTISLAIDNPLNSPNSTFVTLLSWADSILTILFVGEVLLKIVATGFVLDENAYLRNNWNVMDFVITSLATFSLFEGSSRFKFVKTLRTFRALRPLRMIQRNPGLKLVVSSLIASIPQILNVIMVCVLVFLIFSIVAVNNLKGRLYSCRGEAFDALSGTQQDLITYPRLWDDMRKTEHTWFNFSSAEILQSITNQEDLTSRLMCELLGAQWGNTISQSFDNVLRGCQTFFEMTTTEGWVTIMLAGVDATEVDMQPIPNYREGWAFFFIAFILVGTFFVMQLFVGVVIENFNKMKEKLDGTYLLSAAQREWLIINECMLNLRPIRKMKTPQNHFRRKMFRLARNPNFEIGIAGCIVLNTVFMAMHYFGEEDLYRKTIEFSNYVFALIFTCEAAIKITGLGHYYWKDAWNRFDFVIVLGSFIGLLYQWAGGSSVGALATSFRGFRVGRLFRLIQSAPSLRQLFNTLLITLPSLVNIGGLLFLVFFIYAAMGVQLFAKVKFRDLITPTTNFQTIERAMVTLIRCATGERWNDVMYELASTEDCVEDPTYDPTMCGFNNSPNCVALNGCGSPVAFIYLYSFTLLVTFILLNIFIAVVLEGFANEKDRMDGILLPHHYESFVNTWSLFDPEATGFIDWYVLPNFLEALDPPMGFDKSTKPSTKEIMTFVELLDLPVFRKNKVFFNDVARRIGKFVVDETSDEPLKPLPSALNLEQRWRKYLQARKVKRQDHTVFRVNQFNAAVFLHSAVKAQIFRDDLKRKVEDYSNLIYEKVPEPRAMTMSPVIEDVEYAMAHPFEDYLSLKDSMNDFNHH
ncbi:hypothetical protein Poli38472_006189 [Pythium oligandrum]|uniref:EF-hand domain-containing protein n=1 Tax=Pythium oligandrum TaxID=41045 RepID=A0A8K1CRX9_PYTOL|nr:hypothetical protein Poli38472_006189 [Pythium oligandrum]|eukprot:TMW68721.1 hypothetical protein Poli38472_006189 [Pythium oligandrum]